MKDAFGIPQSLLVLGGTSEIALATARRLIARSTRTVWLAGRPSPALEQSAADLRALGAEVRTVSFDALDPESHETALGKVFAEAEVEGRAKVPAISINVISKSEIDSWKPEVQRVTDDWVNEVKEKGADGKALLEAARSLLRQSR